ncbi:hypothetical protein ACWD4O_43650 [Streptomyces sp. NPDC002623]
MSPTAVESRTWLGPGGDDFTKPVAEARTLSLHEHRPVRLEEVHKA